MRRDRQGGFTLIELMVGLVVASIAVGFIFRIYATSSVAYRTQSQLAETMQSLRTAKQVLTKRLRNAGYLMSAGASTINSTSSAGATGTAGIYSFAPIRVVNSSTGPDEIYLSYADSACITQVVCEHGNGNRGCPAFVSAESSVSTTDCFQDGDVAVAVRTGGNNKGASCVLQITSTQANAGHLQHRPSDPWNDNQNEQCTGVANDGSTDVWYDGQTVFMKFSTEGYRIKPNDARGVLQYLPTNSSTWQDIAFGFVDMQFAIQVATKTVITNTTTNAVISTTYSYGWLSGDNMTTFSPGTTTTYQTTASPPTRTDVTTSYASMRLNLLARTVAEVAGPGTTATPSMLGSPAATNNIGDRPSVTISSITNTSSPYYGNYIYRLVSTEVDLRNLSTGLVQ